MNDFINRDTSGTQRRFNAKANKILDFVGFVAMPAVTIWFCWILSA